MSPSKMDENMNAHLSSTSSSASSILLNNLASFSSAKIKLDELFIEFLLSEGNNNLIPLLSQGIKNLNVDSDEEDNINAANEFKSSGGSKSGIPSSSPNAITRKSPKKRTQAEMAAASNSPNATGSSSGNNSAGVASVPAEDKSGTATLSVLNDEKDTKLSAVAESLAGAEDESHLAMRRRANVDSIPPFYHPGKKATNASHLIHLNEEDKLIKRLPEIEAFFKPFPGGIPLEKFVHVTKRLCGIPSFFNLPLCKRINEKFGDTDATLPPPRTIGKAGRQPSGVKIKLKTFFKILAIRN